MQTPLEMILEIRNCSADTQKYVDAIHQENERLTRENAELRTRVNQDIRIKTVVIEHRVPVKDCGNCGQHIFVIPISFGTL